MILIFIGLIGNFVGVLLFFDKGLIALSNFAITIGIGYFIDGGFKGYFKFLFASPQRSIAAVFYLLGLVLIMKKYVMIGLLVTMVSFLCLFKPMLSMFKVILEFVPGIGSIVKKITK